MRFQPYVLAALIALPVGAAWSAWIPTPKPGYPLASGTGVKITQGFNVVWSADRAKRHTGLDISAPAGTPVFAMNAGIVEKTGWLGNDNRGRSWGDYIVVKEDIGTNSGYLHVSAARGVGRTKRVKRGDIIGFVYRDHLHVNRCYQVAGCQHGAFVNATFSKGDVGWYYWKPALIY